MFSSKRQRVLHAAIEIADRSNIGTVEWCSMSYAFSNSSNIGLTSMSLFTIRWPLFWSLA